MHRGDIGLSSNPMAQPSGGTDLFEHSLQVFQGLSLRGAKWPTASHHLCPGDNPHLSNPCHGKPRGAQDQEWGWQFLKILNLYSAYNIVFLTCALPLIPTWGLQLVYIYTAAALSSHQWPCRGLNFSDKFTFTIQRNSEISGTGETYQEDDTVTKSRLL